MNSEITATCFDGMVNIDGKSIAYANIRNMFKTGDGISLQTSLGDNKEAKGICNAIAVLMYDLREHLDEKL